MAKRPGRPAVVTEAVIANALALIAEGASLRRAARKLGVSVGALFAGVTSAPVVERYARARQERAHHIAEEAIEIADRTGKGADVNRDRLRVDTRKWFAARLDPLRWGDKQQLEHSGEVKTAFGDDRKGQLDFARRVAFAMNQGMQALKDPKENNA